MKGYFFYNGSFLFGIPEYFPQRCPLSRDTWWFYFQTPTLVALYPEVTGCNLQRQSVSITYRNVVLSPWHVGRGANSFTLLPC
jgi:hypothetical protein